MATSALSVYAGETAARQLRREGWDASLFSLLLGASGGPKWFVLSELDQVLFGDFLQRSNTPLTTLGSSIGSWRNTCLALDDPAAAVRRLQQGYLYQQFSSRPDAAEVSAVSGGILRATLGEQGAARVATHPRIHSHIVTARGRGPAAAGRGPLLASAMAAAALGNSVHRQALRLGFQRVVFHSGAQAAPGLELADFHTHYAPLGPDNLAAALHASGAIPFVLTGERDIPGAPPGQYWDGGIIDYHFDLAQYRGEGLLLYPHFRPDITPGWFDKFLPWRTRPLQRQAVERLVLLCPNPAWVAQLPLGKIPDRSDFQRLAPDARVRYWEACVARSRALAEEFAELVSGSDPLAGVTVLKGRAAA
ncbi:patatin-like phospholipase family protein [Parahaliea aestuarii]|uniref:Patatin-like phospholipase family protein n=1 Tax=Parahaliea aestuarii TaxID=1852021 RepID=A0A5C8ZQ67_9GAMM|nr:patatin-like phospholipase family protein [Parahaliea aestuarii]TXS90485.1 patatin-like phospholipase family protein [Parahaliea aestuarii]